MNVPLNHIKPLVLSAVYAVGERNDPDWAMPYERVFFENMITVFGLEECMRRSDELREAATLGKSPNEVDGLASALTCGTILLVMLANNARWQVEEDHLKMAVENLVGALMRDSGLEERAFYELIDPDAAALIFEEEVPPNVQVH